MKNIPPVKSPIRNPVPRPLPRPLKLDKSIVLYYDLIDKLSRVKVLDESGKGNHGIIYGATWTPDGLRFDGVDDKVVVANNDSLKPTQISIFALCRVTNVSRIISKNYANGYSLLVAFISGGKARWGFSGSIGGGTANWHYTSGYILPLGEWHVVGFTYDASVFRLYQDRKKVPSAGDGATGDITASNYPLWIGAEPATNASYMNGDVAACLISSKPLDSYSVYTLSEFWRARL